MNNFIACVHILSLNSWSKIERTKTVYSFKSFCILSSTIGNSVVFGHFSMKNLKIEKQIWQNKPVIVRILCLVLLHVPKCFVPLQIFWASPKIWLHLEPPQKPILLNVNHLFVWQKMFVTATISNYYSRSLVLLVGHPYLKGS